MAESERYLLTGVGGLILVLVVTDLFVTIFAYDEFSFIAWKVQRLLWSASVGVGRRLRGDVRHRFLSISSTMLLPATLVLWLSMEVVGFALVIFPGFFNGSFKVAYGAGRGIGSAFYLSAGDLTSLTFGDFVPVASPYRSILDLETVIGLSTFTLALTYVLSAFGATDKLSSLYARIRRNAVQPNRPSTILERRYRSGDPSDLANFLQSVVDELEDYTGALRRFPVAFYFHTRRVHRSTPQILAALGELIELARWGLPSSEALSKDPSLLALLDGYHSMLGELAASFVGPIHPPPIPASFELVTNKLPTDNYLVNSFRELCSEAVRTSGVVVHELPDALFERYLEWLPFHHARTQVIARVADELGYFELA